MAELTEDLLAEFQRIVDAATPGPWERYGYIGQAGLTRVRSTSTVDRVGHPIYRDIPCCEEDAKFLATARTALPACIAEVRRLRAHTESLDANWLAHHDACMSVIRGAVGLTDATVPEIADEIRRLRAAIDEAKQLLLSLQDSAMPSDLPGAISYLIDHSNEGWSRVAGLGDRLDIVREQLETADSRAKEAVQQEMAVMRAKNAELLGRLAEINHETLDDICEHGIQDGEYCEECREAYRVAEKENQ